MKRKNLLKLLTHNGCYPRPKGSSYSQRYKPLTVKIEAVQIPIELSDKPVNIICKSLSIKEIG